MNAIKTLMVSITLMVMSGVIDAEPQSMTESNWNAYNSFLTDNQMNDQKDVDYFKKILTGGGLFALLLAMNTEVPDVAKSVEYVALFKKLNSANHILSRILIELKKNNQLLSQNRLKGVAIDG
jgi:hypothetical protein